MVRHSGSSLHYRVVPLLRRKLFEPLHALYSGSRRLAYWRKLEETQYWDEPRLREVQWLRLSELLHYVHENNFFFRSRFDAVGIRPEDIRSPEDMHKLPILTKKDIRQHTPAMISNGLRNEDLLCFKTGGSTGNSLELFITEECSELRNACARRHDRWTGWEPGEPIGAVWGNPRRIISLREKIIGRLVQPVIYLDTMEFTDASVLRFASEWQLVKPTLLFGHAHSLYLLAVRVRSLGIESIQPRGILSTSMMLLPHERVVIEDVFGMKVFDRYGCEEVSLIGAECEQHDGMHLNIEHLYIEFIREDGSPAEPGEAGKIIVTDLMNRAMPFIRYQVEDVGVPSARKCSCGRGLPLMERVTGRVADFLVKRDGTKVAGVSLIENTLTRIPGIEQMQIVQEALDSIILRVVPGPEFTQDRRDELVGYFERVFGSDTWITMELIEEIKPEESGKYRFSICHVAQG